MSIKYIRKITKSRWNNQLNGDAAIKDIIPADTIVYCLKTEGNTLSIWEVEEVEDAILALASVSNSISTMDVISFEKSFFDEKEIDIENKIATSNPVVDLQKKHYDIINLNYNTLGDVANNIASQAKEDEKNIKRYTIGDIKKIMKKAIEEGRLDVRTLHENLQKHFN